MGKKYLNSPCILCAVWVFFNEVLLGRKIAIYSGHQLNLDIVYTIFFCGWFYGLTRGVGDEGDGRR